MHPGHFLFVEYAGRLVMRFLLASVVIVATISPAAAYTEAQIQACTPDVMRLCASEIPNVGRVSKCMMQKKSQVSAACRNSFSNRVAAK
jgi:hypothetical protein